MSIADANALEDVQGNPLFYASGLKIKHNLIWQGMEQSISATAASIPVQA
jgi:hypothetical protein